MVYLMVEQQFAKYPWCQRTIRGIFEEVVARMKTLGGAVDPADVEAEEPFSGFYKIGHAHVGPFDHECFKLVCTQMLAESGAKLLLHTQFIDGKRPHHRCRSRQ